MPVLILSFTAHHPMLLVVPNGAVFAQWQSKIYSNYPDLHLIIANSDKPTESKYRLHWISGSAMREAPATLNDWPQHLQYISDPTDDRASKAVLLTTYDTLARRTTEVQWVRKDDEHRRTLSRYPIKTARKDRHSDVSTTKKVVLKKS